MSITTNSVSSSPMTTKMWSSLLLKQNKKWSSKSSAKFQVFAVKFKNGTTNRMEDLLNLDLTPFTDKIIAKYIWHMFFFKRHVLSNINSSFYFWNSIRNNLTNTSMACQGLCSKIIKNYAENLLQKFKHQKQFALILKPNPCYTIMILKYDLISIVGSGYQSKWCSIQW